ncbi:MFS transporter [Actinoallomurus soli]|uniref:MFS transporter n=1 Tax=Actinoallomurus soli TaxID=2952535 RepID=UPI00209342AF|nr:MFS transporter [Actinoallomurus soli]MCO5974739.1 MFS transporter [Actinoallomurus soli]
MSSRASRLFGLSLGYFLVLLDTTVLTVALPDLRASLGGGVAGLQWAVTGYTVTFAALLPTAGAVSDRFGAHRVFTAGVAVFGLLSLLSAGAPILPVLVVLRALLGAAGALCLPSSLAIITRLYPVPAERGRALGAWAAITGCALAAGPVVGGLLVSAGGWRAVFLANVPVALVSLLLVRGIQVPATGRAIDWRAQLVACAFLAVLTDAIVDRRVVSAVAAGVLALVMVVVDRRSASPAVPGAVIAEPAVRRGLIAGAAVNFALSGGLFVLTLSLQRHLGPVATGLAFLPLTLPTAFNPLVTGRLVARYGPRPPVLAGLTLLTLGCLAAPSVSWLGMLLIGFGVSFSLPALVTGVVQAAPEGAAGVASGLLNAVRQVGATLGVAVMGGLATGTAFAVAAALCLAAGLILAIGGGRS